MIFIVIIYLLCFYLFCVLYIGILLFRTVHNFPLTNTDEFIKCVEMIAEYGECTIKWYITKSGVYHYVLVLGTGNAALHAGSYAAHHTESKEPLEFPANCKLIEMSRKWRKR